MLDHKPILLELIVEKNLSPISFCFSQAWIKQDGFQDLVQSVWKNMVSGSPIFVWEERLRHHKVALKSWDKTLNTPLNKRIEAQ